jgi:hypothetical protein
VRQRLGRTGASWSSSVGTGTGDAPLTRRIRRRDPAGTEEALSGDFDPACRMRTIPDLDQARREPPPRAAMRALMLAPVVALLVPACAKSLEALAPFPCAADGTCPAGFVCGGLDGGSPDATPICTAPDMPIVCATANEANSVMLTCPKGTIESVAFASYGTPSGVCGDFQDNGSCHSATSEEVVEDACIGEESCTIVADNDTFGDPCVGTGKMLYVEVRCE